MRGRRLTEAEAARRAQRIAASGVSAAAAMEKTSHSAMSHWAKRHEALVAQARRDHRKVQARRETGDAIASSVEDSSKVHAGADGDDAAPARRAPAAPIVGVHAAEEWLYRAGPGETLVYHRGDLASDRSTLPALGRIADMLAKHPRVILTQRRLGEGRFEYIATKRRRDPSRPALRGRDPGHGGGS